MPETTLPIQLGDAVEHRGVAITPLFPRRDPVAAYITLDEALPRGFGVREVSEAGAVPELLVENPLAEDVLLYDGEELVGAKQNRILNVTVLVAASATLPIPVSCVEQGRWRRESAGFRDAAHAANPQLRRRKAQALRSEPLARGIAQADVWEAVTLKAHELGVASPTRANADAFRAHRSTLATLERAFPLQPGQCGAIFAVGDDLCVDLVSRPDAFARLYPKLRMGYLLDALGQLDSAAPTADAARSFLTRVASATTVRRASAGRGDDVRLESASVVGSGLELDGELIQLCAFTGDEHRSRTSGRIARPSARR